MAGEGLVEGGAADNDNAEHLSLLKLDPADHKTSAEGTGNQVNLAQRTKQKEYRVFTENELKLEPLCEELTAYLSERMISAETLRRNAVMQRKFRCENFIAFPYRQDGVVVTCKYRNVKKKYLQEKNTDRIFYGLDDIKCASDIIIVEGEIDKLSMEEAGYLNCVSVPDGAPGKVSNKPLPDEQEDTNFRYIWACKEHLEKASRIILATDADQPGQCLAEELARRLGKERCWRVKWPKKNDTDDCKDANEVLMFLGRDALKEVINNAELYPKSEVVVQKKVKALPKRSLKQKQPKAAPP